MLDADEQRQGFAFGQWRAAFTKAEAVALQNAALLMVSADVLGQAGRDADEARLHEFIFQQYNIHTWEGELLKKAAEAAHDYQTLPSWLRHGYEPKEA